MATRKFVKKIIIKTFMYVVISIIALSLMLNSPVITNQMAIGQMENSNNLYIIMETYNKIKYFVSIIYSCFTAAFVGTTVYDIYKFISTQNKGEN